MQFSPVAINRQFVRELEMISARTGHTVSALASAAVDHWLEVHSDMQPKKQGKPARKKARILQFTGPRIRTAK